MRSIFDNLELFQTTEVSWEQKLINKVGGVISGTDSPFREILRIAKKLGCCSCIIEREYVDADYLEEYSAFYSRSFRDYDSKSIRLHFFKDIIKHEDLIDLMDKNYLGYSVVRPIRSFRSGRTVMVSPYDDGNKYYTICKAEFEVNLSGNQLKVCGMPFLQQDTNVCVCAEAALWMINLYLHKKYQMPLFRASEIASFATKHITVGPVRQGLNNLQILDAMRQMSYNAIQFPKTSVASIVRTIYSYVESGIPVMLTLELPGNKGHAITVIGHDYNIKIPFPATSRDTVSLIEHFCYQDDAAGPYKELKINEVEGGLSVEKNVTHALVPLPKEITMQADDVYLHAKSLLNISVLNTIISYFRNAENCKFKQEEISGIITRIYLRRSNDFKNTLCQEMNPQFRLRYRTMRMPKYIWIIELSKEELIKKPLSVERRMIGEIIVDSTADRHAYFESYLCIHLLGRMFIRGPNERLPLKLYFVPNELPYPHLVRNP